MELKRDHSESKFAQSEPKRRGIFKLNNGELLSDPRNSNIFNVKSSDKYKEDADSALNIKKNLIRDLRDFQPPPIETKKLVNNSIYTPIIDNEISDLMRKQEELFKKLLKTSEGKKKHRNNNFKKVAEKYEERIHELENKNFSHSEVMNLQNQLLELQKNQVSQEPQQHQHQSNFIQNYVYQSKNQTFCRKYNFMIIN